MVSIAPKRVSLVYVDDHDDIAPLSKKRRTDGESMDAELLSSTRPAEFCVALPANGKNEEAVMELEAEESDDSSSDDSDENADPNRPPTPHNDCADLYNPEADQQSQLANEYESEDSDEGERLLNFIEAETSKDDVPVTLASADSSSDDDEDVFEREKRRRIRRANRRKSMLIAPHDYYDGEVEDNLDDDDEDEDNAEMMHVLQPTYFVHDDAYEKEEEVELQWYDPTVPVLVDHTDESEEVDVVGLSDDDSSCSAGYEAPHAQHSADGKDGKQCCIV